jgi:hypothetical protein
MICDWLNIIDKQKKTYAKIKIVSRPRNTVHRNGDCEFICRTAAAIGAGCWQFSDVNVHWFCRIGDGAEIHALEFLQRRVEFSPPVLIVKQP